MKLEQKIIKSRSVLIFLSFLEVKINEKIEDKRVVHGRSEGGLSRAVPDSSGKLAMPTPDSHRDFHEERFCVHLLCEHEEVTHFIHCINIAFKIISIDFINSFVICVL